MSRKKLRKTLRRNKRSIIVGEVVFFVCLVVGISWYELNQGQKNGAYSNLQENSTENVNEEASSNQSQNDINANALESKTEDDASLNSENWQANLQVTSCVKSYDLDALANENPDIYAWLFVPGTKVDYPILQSTEDNYYLLHNLDGSEGHPGCLYTNSSLNGQEFSDPVTIIYGHNMTDGSMFGTLHYFDDEAFFSANTSFYIYTDECRYEYKIYAVREHNTNYLPAEYFLLDTEGCQEFIDMTLAAAESDIDHIRSNVSVTPNDHIVVLSTCGETSESRYLVCGVCVGIGEYQ